MSVQSGAKLVASMVSVAIIVWFGLWARTLDLNSFQRTTVWIVLVLAIGTVHIFQWRTFSNTTGPCALRSGLIGGALVLGYALILLAVPSDLTGLSPFGMYAAQGVRVGVGLAIVALDLMWLFALPK